MKAVVLAAGEGSRLEPLTGVRPKPMLPVANRPLLEHVIEAVAGAGIDEVVLVVGYKRERIQSHFEDGDDWGIDIEYAIQEKQLGTGHAIRQAEPHVEDTFLVLNGDRIIDPDLIERVRDAEEVEGTVMSVTRTREPSDYGVVEVEDDCVVGIEEKPPDHAVSSELINAGVYRFTPRVFDAIRDTETTGELAITATLERLAGDDQVRAVNYRGTWLDVSHLWDVIEVNASVLDRGMAVEETARVHERATVTGTTAIGADAWVAPGAAVLGGSAIGDNVSVGPNAVIENAVVFDDVTVDAGAVLRDCVVGETARIGANATVEGGEADVVVDGSVHEGVTLGGVVGDGASLGGAVTLQPGSVIGNDSTVEGGTTVDGRIPDDATVRRG